MTLAHTRREYLGQPLTEEASEADPVRQFGIWFEQVRDIEMDPTAMALATAGRDGRPSVRTVLMKGFDESGFVFYTNYASRKERELEETRRASLLFVWRTVERQVRMRLESGYTEVVAQEERAQGRKTIKEAADEFLEAYKAKHRAATFAEYALGHVARLLGGKLVLETTPGTVKKYQTDRLAWTIPFVLYGIFRYLYLVHQKEKGGSPTDILATDRPLLINVALWALTIVVIVYTAGGSPMPLQR